LKAGLEVVCTPFLVVSPIKPAPNKLLVSPCLDGTLVPSSAITRFVLSKNCIPYSKDLSHHLVCDACQQAKSHQLSYPMPTSQSKDPLELVFSDVWGPACDSIRKNKFYVSFIDDFSKFT
jgi:hypothetical protein